MASNVKFSVELSFEAVQCLLLRCPRSSLAPNPCLQTQTQGRNQCSARQATGSTGTRRMGRPLTNGKATATQGGVLVQVPVDGWGWGARRLGLAGRFPRVFWGCLSRRAPGEEGGTLALLWEPQGTSRLWRRVGTAVLTSGPPQALLGNPVSEDTSSCSPEPPCRQHPRNQTFSNKCLG